ncbi:MAG: Hsp20/alpha crystallin family protein [Thermoprotei archaeon]|nr:MAG: Hsp20/alpha crystallin family protein [Thermoprotei archaeon]
MSEFDEWFRRTRKFFEEIDKIFEDMFRRGFLPFEEEGKERKGRRVYGPYYYGFSVTVGPDGVPKIREWGNIKPGRISPVITETIEPFTDVIEEEDKVRIVIDVPGVEKEDINVEAAEDEVVVSAARGDRRYRKVIRLPVKVKPDTAKATYKNGVLTITIEKVEKGKKGKGFKIKVE